MQKILLSALAAASISSAAVLEEPPVFTSVAFGGGGGICKFSSSQSGIVVGQPYAGKPGDFATLEDGTILDLEHGFWINLSSLVPSKIQTPQNQSHLTSINARFLSHSIAVDVSLAEKGPVSIQFVDMQGRQVISAWKETLSAGSHNIELPVVGFSSQNLILKVQAGQNTQTFRFTPNHP